MAIFPWNRRLIEMRNETSRTVFRQLQIMRPNRKPPKEEPKMHTRPHTLTALLIISLATCFTITPVGSANNESVNLEIKCTQESVLNDGKNLLVLYCISHGLAIVELRTSMSLAVQVGDQTATFRANGTKTIHADAKDQEYNISGSSTLICRARDKRGNESRIQVTYSYLGDGSLRLDETDSGKAVPVTLKQTNSKVVTMDLSTGEGETEITLRLQR